MLAHDALAVLQGVAQAAFKEGAVETVVGVAGNNAHADFGVVVDKSCAQVVSLSPDHVNPIAGAV